MNVGVCSHDMDKCRLCGKEYPFASVDLHEQFFYVYKGPKGSFFGAYETMMSLCLQCAVQCKQLLGDEWSDHANLLYRIGDYQIFEDDEESTYQYNWDGD